MPSEWPFPSAGTPEERLAEATRALVDVPSVYGDEAELADRIEDWAQRLSLPCRRMGNALLVGEASPDGVLFAGHLDTVPPPDGKPPRGVVEGDRVVGLGSSDMKAGLAVMMLLLQEPPGSVPVAAVFYDKEEGPHLDSGLIGVLEAAPELASCGVAIVMEPTDNVLQLGCVGSLHAEVTFEGRAAHSARPWQGDNAIHRAAPMLTRLAAYQRREVLRDGLTFYEVMSATLAEGGTSRGTVPARFSLNVNFRFAPGRTAEDAEEELLVVIGSEAQVEIIDRAPGGQVSRANPWVQRLEAAVEGKVEPKQAWTDVARLTEMGLDAVNFGPGHTSQAHQVGEYVERRALAESYSVLRALLES